MLDLRIFVSSPGDVGREREIAQRIIARLQGEFTAQARLTPYFWEHEPMLANAGDYQENIPAPSDFDIFLCLLWSRLGTRLGSKHRTRDGKTFESGTASEFQNALEAARRSASPELPRGRPDMLIFVKKAPLVIEPEPKEVRDERYRQFDALQDFIRFAFRDQTDGTFAIASNTFIDLAEFEDRLEKGLRRCILERLPDGVADDTPPPATYTAGPPFLGLRHFDKDHAAGLLITVDWAGPESVEAEAPASSRPALILVNAPEMQIVPGREGWQALPSLKTYDEMGGGKDPKSAAAAAKAWKKIERAIPKKQYMQTAG
jgi:hypothetical protein